MSQYSTTIQPKLERGHGLMYDDDDRILHLIAKRGKTFIEVGTYCGGSAIIAGLAGCEVTGIDTWAYPGEMKTFRPTPDDVRVNWEAAGLDPDKLHLYQHSMPPLPAALVDTHFDIGFIDGDHTAVGCWNDWLSLQDRVDKYMLLHDANRAGPYWTWLKALKENRNWGRVALPFGCTTTIRILKRVGRAT